MKYITETIITIISIIEDTMKKMFTMYILLLSLIKINPQDVNISNIKFQVEKISAYTSTFINVRTDVYNIAYSSILPDNGIYKIVSLSNNREAIIQIAYSMTSTPPEKLYITDNLYSFFGSNDPAVTGKIETKLVFLGWSNTNSDAENDFLNIQNMVVPPENAMSQLTTNGGEKFYIQLGSFSYYQNSYPKITQLLPYLELRPSFFMVEHSEASKNKVYRVLAGPYSREDAIKISRTINSKVKEPVYLKTGESIIKQGK